MNSSSAKSTSILGNKWVQLVVSLVSLAAIIGIYEAIKAPLFDWSITVITNIQTNTNDGLKYTCAIISWLGGNIPNIVVIVTFTAMFKRRH